MFRCPGEGGITQGFQLPTTESTSGLVKQGILRILERVENLGFEPRQPGTGLACRLPSPNDSTQLILLLSQFQIQALAWMHPTCGAQVTCLYPSCIGSWESEICASVKKAISFS